MRTKAAVVLGRVAGPQWPIEATLFAWQDWFTTLLTTRHGPEKRAVGIEMLPGSTSREYSPALREAWSRQWIARLNKLDQTSGVKASALPSLLNVAPLLDALDRYECHAPLSRQDAITRWEYKYTMPITPDLAASASDAQTYAYAVAAGESAARALSAAHNITVRSAEGRIRRARQRGLLTAHENPRMPSMLTEKAADAIEWLTGDRPYPYVAENGEVVLGPR